MLSDDAISELSQSVVIRCGLDEICLLSNDALMKEVQIKSILSTFGLPEPNKHTTDHLEEFYARMVLYGEVLFT